jgi:hypothetical protein
MNPRLLINLEKSFASCSLEVTMAKEVILEGLCSSSEYWAGLAVGWLEQGAPLDAEIVEALDKLNTKPKQISQGVRHRAFALARRWCRTQSGPNMLFNPDGFAAG